MRATTIHADHDRKIHVRGYHLRKLTVLVMFQLDSKRLIANGGSGIPAWLSRAEARRLHSALGRILKSKRPKR